ncbi:hypothetical protein IE53DRAFT_263827 [Violaceomyces palustris]|uniref:Uncharacterized protein n=2 Tax=Violaceomyces palustris TaxID=1673888 RepID=A0ACD0P3K7_9BASI|nr:hypothetical protein IE53DRAFT_114291 [Violaceomyces palustris]PWN52646.1 hypothetical protein IE53DRAFT_263827 [Violaceomyces palustris]
MKASIHLTVCDIETASQRVPMECSEIMSPEVRKVSGEEHKVSGCIEALSRSAQFWSSYSGYIREVPQLCFALRRWHDIDKAKEVYQQLSLQKKVLMEDMKRSVEERSKSDERARDVLVKWERAMDNFIEMHGKMENQSTALIRQMESKTMGLLNSIQTEISFSLERIMALSRGRW